MKDTIEIPAEEALEMLAKVGTGPYFISNIEDHEKRLDDYMVTQVMNGADPRVVIGSLPRGGAEIPMGESKPYKSPRSILKRDKEDKEWMYETRRK